MKLADDQSEMKTEASALVPNKDGSGDFKDGLYNRLIDCERIELEGPSLRVVTENMRSLLACTAMMAACTFLYTSEPQSGVKKVIAILVGIWVAFYTLLACAQFMHLVAEAIIRLAYHIFHPKLLQRNKEMVVMIFALAGMLMFLGMMFVIISSVSRASGH